MANLVFSVKAFLAGWPIFQEFRESHLASKLPPHFFEAAPSRSITDYNEFALSDASGRAAWRMTRADITLTVAARDRVCLTEEICMRYESREAGMSVQRPSGVGRWPRHLVRVIAVLAAMLGT